MYKIKQFSKLTGLTVRMLRHYDKIGLLVADYVTPENGYRYYAEKSLATAQQIIFFKELEFSLPEIKDILAGQSVSQQDALFMQKNLLKLKENLNYSYFSAWL